MRKMLPAAGSLLSLLTAGAPAAQADAVADFYSGKSINLFIGSTPGGGYDTYGRLMAQFLGDHIPGKPKIVPRNMPGGEGRVASAYLYEVAPKDGLSLATSEQFLPLAQALGDKTVKADTSRLIWIGNPSRENKTIVSWHTTGVKTIEDARKTAVKMGTTGGGGSASTYPLVLNALIDTRFELVRGYRGGTEVNLAMENGEVGGRAGNTLLSWKVSHENWLRENKINILVQVGFARSPELPNVPLMTDLVDNADDRALMTLLSVPIDLGHPLYVAPGVPGERVEALRKAFNAMMQDAAFREAAAKRRIEIDPVTGERMQQIVADMFAAPQSLRDRLAAFEKGK
jgi:tripartite-type tricarboxylate transporter receptor subunit TctC